jgi:hypothetical protein
MLVIATLLAVLNGALVQSETRRPDFSGSWTFDAQKTMTPDKDGRVVLAAMLGEEFTAIQTATSLTLRILNNGQLVVAVYDLTGRSSENVSPGDIAVTSRAKWDGDRLLISSTSTSEEKGKRVTVETTRILSIDPAGDLIIERTGTPKSLVTPSRSVYRRSKP